MIIRVITALLLVLALAGCEQERTPEGDVSNKTHFSGWVESRPLIVGKITTVTPVFHPDVYRIELTHMEQVTETCNVTAYEFDSIKMGQHYICK